MEKQINNKQDYLKKLGELIKNLPEIERQNAIKYYDEYFNEAGKENELAVIEELGDVELLAKQIQNTDAFKQESEDDTNQKDTNYRDTLAMLLLIAILVFGIPVIFPIILGIFLAIIAITCSGVVMGIMGIVFLSMSIPILVSNFFGGVLMLGVSLILIALGILFTVIIGWALVKIIPVSLRWFVNICKRVIGRGE